MSNDLISRVALLEEIENGENKPEICDGMQEVDWIMKCIKNAPIAYDVASVIEQLEKDLENCEAYHKKYGHCGNQIYAYKNALEIVKSGGMGTMNGR